MMTSSQIKAFDVREESKTLRDAYGDTAFGRGCLAARRLVEVGVRCVEVTLDGWDSHAKNHEICARQAGILDAGFSSLIRDLRERKLLERTVVVCVGEFGRTPQGEVRDLPGRDHHIEAFTMWLAGGGAKPGVTLGKTDEIGYYVVEDRTHVHDLHATILHLLGLDHLKLTFRFQGRDFRLTDVAGNVIPKVIA